ncbi:MAG TPA: LysM domain-containing protein, partial [Polyangiaceae bacterium]|nr:LysM domain-containing protein [Polyangiaceae bacterium]
MELENYLGDTGTLDVCADPYSDVGWFGSNIVKSVGHAASSVAHKVAGATKSVVKAVSKAPIGIVSGQWVTNAVAKRILGDKVYNSLVPTQYRSALDAMNKLGALRPHEVLPALLAGATAKGVGRALQVAGDSGLSPALSAAAQNFAPGTQGAAAFGVAQKILASGNATKDVLAAARSSLGNFEQQKAFDTAVGIAAGYADKLGKPMQSPRITDAIKRQNRIAGTKGPRPINVLPQAVRRNPVGVLPTAVRLAVQKVARNGGNITAAANEYGAPASAVRRVMGTKLAPRFGWRSLSSPAAALVLRHMPHTPIAALQVMHGRDTGSLAENGTVYIVENGDYPAKIAKKLTGKDTNWPQLIAANPQKKTKMTNIGKVFVSLFAGERLILPKSWVTAAPPSPITTTTATPASAPPAVDSSNENTAAVLQAKSLLAT